MSCAVSRLGRHSSLIDWAAVFVIVVVVVDDFCSCIPRKCTSRPRAHWATRRMYVIREATMRATPRPCDFRAFLRQSRRNIARTYLARRRLVTNIWNDSRQSQTDATQLDTQLGRRPPDRSRSNARNLRVRVGSFSEFEIESTRRNYGAECWPSRRSSTWFSRKFVGQFLEEGGSFRGRSSSEIVFRAANSEHLVVTRRQFASCAIISLKSIWLKNFVRVRIMSL